MKALPQRYSVPSLEHASHIKGLRQLARSHLHQVTRLLSALQSLAHSPVYVHRIVIASNPTLINTVLVSTPLLQPGALIPDHCGASTDAIKTAKLPSPGRYLSRPSTCSMIDRAPPDRVIIHIEFMTFSSNLSLPGEVGLHFRVDDSRTHQVSPPPLSWTMM